MIKTALADCDNLVPTRIQTWWLCISSCCFSSNSDWACWLALVGSDWLEHWGKRKTSNGYNEWGKKMPAQSAKLHFCLTAPVVTWGQLIQVAYEDLPPRISKLLSPHYSALTALIAQSSAAWSPHLHCCKCTNIETIMNQKIRKGGHLFYDMVCRVSDLL